MSPDVAAVNQASMAIEAAVDGQGIALARTALAALDVLAGRLIPPFDLRLPASYAYYIVCPPAFAERPKVRTKRDWLLAEASDDAARLEKLRRGEVENRVGLTVGIFRSAKRHR